MSIDGVGESKVGLDSRVANKVMSTLCVLKTCTYCNDLIHLKNCYNLGVLFFFLKFPLKWKNLSFL